MLEQKKSEDIEFYKTMFGLYLKITDEAKKRYTELHPESDFGVIAVMGIIFFSCLIIF